MAIPLQHDGSDGIAADPQEQIVVRLLVGAQRGASMPLLAPSYVVGNGDDCDIVLADDSLAAAHAKLLVSDGVVTLEAVEGEVFFDNSVLKPHEQAELRLPVALSMGLVVVGVGGQSTDWTSLPVTEPWPTDDAEDEDLGVSAEGHGGDGAGDADPQMPEADALGSEERIRNATGSSQADGESNVQDDGAIAPPTDGEGETPDGGHTDPAKASLARRLFHLLKRRYGLVAAATTVALVVCAVGLAMLGDSPPKPEPDVQLDAATRTHALIAATAAVAHKLGLDDISFDPMSDGSVKVTGFVPTLEKRNQLHGALAEAAVRFSDRTYVVDEVLELIRSSLSASTWPVANFEDHLVVSYRGNGEFDIDGFLGPQVDKGQLRRRLEADVPGIETLRFTRSDVRDWIEVLNQRIDDAGLSLWLKSAEDNANIRVTGELNAEQANTWRQVGRAFVKESRGWPKLTIDVTSFRTPPIVAKPAAAPTAAASSAAASSADAPPEIASAPDRSVIRPNMAVIGVVLSNGKPDHVLFANGETYAEGEVLDGGGTVGKIEMNRVTIEKGGHKFVYRVEGG